VEVMMRHGLHNSMNWLLGLRQVVVSCWVFLAVAFFCCGTTLNAQEQRADEKKVEEKEVAEKSAPGAPVGQKLVVVIPVKEPIATESLFLFRRALREAEQRRASAVVIEMDTWGGSVDATEKIMKLLARTNIPTYTYINTKAISAGSYIAAATQYIYMAPMSEIGASTAVSMMEESDEIRKKRMAAMRALMRAAAEKNGHRPEVFEAMVDPDIEIELDGKKIVEKGRLLVLTAAEAEKIYSNKEGPPTPLLSLGTMKDLDEMLRAAKLDDATLHTIELTGFERVARFISWLSPILIMVGLLAIYIEFHTPGFGVAGITAIICFALVFFGSYLAGLAGWELFMLMMLGVALLAVEIFLLPGFGVTGIAGILCLVIALVLMMAEKVPGSLWMPSWEQLHFALAKLMGAVVGALILGFFLGKFLPKTTFWKKMELSPAAVTAPDKPTDFVAAHIVGATGVTETMLRPSGKARIDGKLVDAMTQGEMIEKGQRVKVIGANGAQVIVVKVA
jgi:membrane-bound serine protease (ClpP class)